MLFCEYSHSVYLQCNSYYNTTLYAFAFIYLSIAVTPLFLFLLKKKTQRLCMHMDSCITRSLTLSIFYIKMNVYILSLVNLHRF